MNRAIEWFARNTVAANLLMILILVGGFVAMFSVKQEVFPEFSLDIITVDVPYLGAAPEEVEEGVCIRVEEAIQGLDGIKKVTSTALEGMGRVVVELEMGSDTQRILDDIKSRVDAIDTFPREAEKPVVTELTNRRQVIDVAVSGPIDEKSLKVLAERVRDDLTALEGITVVEIANARPYELSIEISEFNLRRYGISFDYVANAIRRSSLDLPGGSIKTDGGEILLRSVGQAYLGTEFEALTLLTRPDGSQLRLGEVAKVIDGFAETDQFARFNGEPMLLVEAFRTGDQSALDIAGKVKNYIEQTQPTLPAGVKLSIWADQSKVLRDRLDLLIRNGITGLLLVFGVLALFLRFRLAFWVSLGIPISFLGAFWLMPTLDVSVNLISLFAFIVVLGIVVDDAIVTGENIYTHQHRHGEGLRGAIEGAWEVAVPVTFGVATTIAAFFPLLNVSGTIGKVMRVIPMIVIPCLIFSFVESKLILPAHMSHMRKRDPNKKPNPWHRFQDVFSRGLRFVANNLYRRTLDVALRWRYATLAIGTASLIFTIGIVGAGHIRFVFFPSVEADHITAALSMPQGTHWEITERAVEQIEESARLLQGELDKEGHQGIFKKTVASIGNQPFRVAQARNAGQRASGISSGHLGEVTIELMPAEERTGISSDELAKRWRTLTGKIPDATELSFSASLFSPGEDINVQLTGKDLDKLVQVAEELKAALAEFAGVYEISDSFEEGKAQVELAIKPQAESLGLTQADLARQVRQAFYGEEAQRVQRGRDDIRVMVRFPREDRESLGDLETMRIRTPQGAQVPFSEVAEVGFGRGFANITRVDRRRAVNVTADVDTGKVAVADIMTELEGRIMPALLANFPGIKYSYEGQAAEQRETMDGLKRGFAVALILIFALLAVPLKSYLQPVIIMLAIPFGLVGAIWGHMIMGMNLTILSMFGVVALAGVVVNDSLVMVDFINRGVAKGGDLIEAVRDSGVVRFRPILLTSLTTFAGLLPLLLEKSMQARFLVPMAISLAFGVMFSTFISLVMVPCGYVVLEDFKRLFR